MKRYVYGVLLLLALGVAVRWMTYDVGNEWGKEPAILTTCIMDTTGRQRAHATVYASTVTAGWCSVRGPGFIVGELVDSDTQEGQAARILAWAEDTSP